MTGEITFAFEPRTAAPIHVQLFSLLAQCRTHARREPLSRLLSHPRPLRLSHPANIFLVGQLYITRRARAKGFQFRSTSARLPERFSISVTHWDSQKANRALHRRLIPEFLFGEGGGEKD